MSGKCRFPIRNLIEAGKRNEHRNGLFSDYPTSHLPDLALARQVSDFIQLNELENNISEYGSTLHENYCFPIRYARTYRIGEVWVFSTNPILFHSNLGLYPAIRPKEM